jgi:hypothetical protein
MRHRCINPGIQYPPPMCLVSRHWPHIFVRPVRLWLCIATLPNILYRIQYRPSYSYSSVFDKPAVSLSDVAIHVVAQASRAPTTKSHMPWYQPTNTIRGYEGTVSISSQDQVLDIIYINDPAPRPMMPLCCRPGSYPRRYPDAMSEPTVLYYNFIARCGNGGIELLFYR